MKKIFLLFASFFIFCNVSFANTNNYLYRNSYYIYNLDSYFFDKNNNTHSIDIFYTIHKNLKMDENIISFNDNNNQIQFIIFNVRSNSKKQFLNFKYKGFITGNWELNGMTYLLKNTHIYYANYPKLKKIYKKCIKQFKKYAYLKENGHYIDFEKDINDIYNAHKNKTYSKLNGYQSTLNDE